MKFIGFLIVIALTIAFLKPEIFQNWKRKTIEFINPAAKEKRLINDLGSHIRELNGLIGSIGPISKSDKEKIKRIGSILENSQSIISQVEDLNEKGDIAATLNNLIQKVLPKVAERLDPQPTWIPPGKTAAECISR